MREYHDRAHALAALPPSPLSCFLLSLDRPCRRGRSEGRPPRVQAAQVPLHRPIGRRTCRARVRRPRRPAHLLRRHGCRRRLEVDRRRHALEADLRRPAHRVHRQYRRRAVRSERDLRRLRRGEHSRQRPAGQWHLQVDRRRQDVEARLAAYRADRHHARPSDECARRLRRRPRPRVRAKRGARRLSYHRRRQDVAARAVRQPGRRRLRRLLRSEQRTRPLRGNMADAPAAMGADERRSRQRPVHLARRWRFVDATRGPARRR